MWSDLGRDILEEFISARYLATAAPHFDSEFFEEDSRSAPSMRANVGAVQIATRAFERDRNRFGREHSTKKCEWCGKRLDKVMWKQARFCSASHRQLAYARRLDAGPVLKKCIRLGCDRRTSAKGLCQAHYKRVHDGNRSLAPIGKPRGKRGAR